MSWSSRRQLSIVSGIFILVFIPVAIITFKSVYKAPTCFDNLRNGDEVGVDCGGSCSLLCKNQTIDPIVLWQRVFEVSPGTYNVMSMVENVNIDAGVESAPYTFELYNRENVLLASRAGTVRISPKSIMPIIETGLFTDQLTPDRVSFKFGENFVWQREVPFVPLLIVKDEILSNEDSEPRINAVLQNISLEEVEDIKVIVVVYDENDNAIGTSRTIVESISKDSNQNIIFTWPQPFKEDIARFEIIPLYESPL